MPRNGKPWTLEADDALLSEETGLQGKYEWIVGCLCLAAGGSWFRYSPPNSRHAFCGQLSPQGPFGGADKGYVSEGDRKAGSGSSQ